MTQPTRPLDPLELLAALAHGLMSLVHFLLGFSFALHLLGATFNTIKRSALWTTFHLFAACMSLVGVSRHARRL